MNRTSKENSAHPYGQKAAKAIYEVIEMLAFTVMTVLLLTVLVCRNAVVDGPSMENTLQNGEPLLLSNLFYTPKQGDIVVFDDLSIGDRSPGRSSALVKRVIAVGGQHVSIREDGVYVDGQKLSEEYVYIDDAAFSYEKRGHTMEVDVPEGYLFVMGDHRNNSLDSRSFGVVDERAVLGRVRMRLLPFRLF